jgi:glutamate/tyrosine decarboxylase-like PLP-dependent enzyme
MGARQKDQRSLTFGRTALRSAEDDSYARIAAWFLGPKGENGQFLKDTLGVIAEEHARFRSEHYKPGAPPYIDEKIRSMDAFKQAQRQLARDVLQLMEQLRSSEPFFSPRYQGHMNWDTVLPGNLGYLAAMLYNQNNVATEASPVTSKLEHEVGAQLCAMIGYGAGNGSLASWGHITADGSIANLEAMWMARNLKLYPLALRKLLKEPPTHPTYRYVETESVLVTTAGQKKPLAETSDWECLNVPPDEVMGLPDAIATHCLPGVPEGVPKVRADVREWLVQSKGLGQYAQTYPCVSGLRVLVPATKHYSWPKAGTILGIGSDGVIGISVGDRCQLDLVELRKTLDDCLAKKAPLLTVVAVMGSTEEGAVDDLAGIVSLRDEYRDTGLSFLLHCDAAWGGYLRSIIVPADRGDADAAVDRDTDSGYVPTVPLSSYAKKQFGCLASADTVTIDPHKAGFLPYPACSLSYRDKRMLDLITIDAAYLHSDPVTNMGIYGVEGSKPGAAAAAVWLAHKTIPLDQDGYGRLLAECNYTTKLYYCYWVTLTGADDKFDLEPLIPLPDELVGASGQTLASGEREVKAWIRARIVGRSNEELGANADAMAVLSEVGPDVLINAFVVNKRGNTDPGLCSKLNQELFDKHFSMVKSGGEVRDDLDLILTMSALGADKYGVALERLRGQLGLDKPTDELNFFINTILQPWPTTHGYLTSITEAFRTTVNAAVQHKETPAVPAPAKREPPDLVKAVPTDATGGGKLTLGSRSYAGLVTVNEAKTNQLYYWFLERQVVARDDANLAEVPLVVWLNGGPGASSLVGQFTENGPLRMTDCGAVTRNEYAWNRDAHLLLLGPAGSGTRSDHNHAAIFFST